MIHTCGAAFPAEIGAYVTHVAECPDSGAEIGAWCRALVGLVTDAALAETPETPAVSHETPDETRETPSETGETQRDTAVPTTARLAELRDSGMSLRDLAVLADIAPETVRRRIARHRAGGGS